MGGGGGGQGAGWGVGQLAAAMPLHPCGRCRWCLAGEVAHCERLEMIGLGGRSGGFAELVRVDPALSFALPAEVGELAALTEPLAVGLHAAATARISPGDRVLIIGGGSVGAAVATRVSRLGAREIVVSDPVAHRRDDAGTFGATGVHDPADGPLPTGFDVVIECVGIPGMIQAAIDATAVHGRVVVAGVCTAPETITAIGGLMKEVSVRFAVFYRRQEFELVAAALASGAVDPAPFVSSTVGLDGVDGAFAHLLSTTVERKIVVVPGA